MKATANLAIAVLDGTPRKQLRAMAKEALGEPALHEQVQAWLRGPDTGLSSEFMCAALAGLPLPRRETPSDGGDFGRCVTMLDACPLLRPRLTRMARHGKTWALIVEHWDAWESQWRIEQADPAYRGKWQRRPGKRANAKDAYGYTYEKESLLYPMMRAVLDKAEAADGWVRVGDGVSIRCGS